MGSAVAHSLIQKSLVGEAIDGAPVAVFVADDDGEYLAVNQYACDLLGYDRAELLELRVTDVAVNETAAADYGTMRREGTSAGRPSRRRAAAGRRPGRGFARPRPRRTPGRAAPGGSGAT